MSNVLLAFKEAFKPALASAQAYLMSRKLLRGLEKVGSKYDFSTRDIELYARERFCRLPGITLEATDEADLLRATVCGRSIFWPAQLSPKDLPWLHHEVFDPFDGNPSSYDHPSLDYEHRRWVIDAGAAEGYFSIFALGKSAGNVISVEPLTLMKRALAKTLALHANGRQAVVESAALGENPAWAELHVNVNHVCDSELLDLAIRRDSADDVVTERVQVTTVDILAKQHSLAEGGLIKMDIEGCEMAALSGAANTLRDCKPVLAIAVYHGLDNARRCAEIVKTANPAYRIEFRGYYGYFDPPRPYMLFAY